MSRAEHTAKQFISTSIMKLSECGDLLTNFSLEKNFGYHGTLGKILFKCPNVAIGSVCRPLSLGGGARDWAWVGLEIL